MRQWSLGEVSEVESLRQQGASFGFDDGAPAGLTQHLLHRASRVDEAPSRKGSDKLQDPMDVYALETICAWIVQDSKGHVFLTNLRGPSNHRIELLFTKS